MNKGILLCGLLCLAPNAEAAVERSEEVESVHVVLTITEQQQKAKQEAVELHVLLSGDNSCAKVSEHRQSLHYNVKVCRHRGGANPVLAFDIHRSEQGEVPSKGRTRRMKKGQNWSFSTRVRMTVSEQVTIARLKSSDGTGMQIDARVDARKP